MFHSTMNSVKALLGILSINQIEPVAAHVINDITLQVLLMNIRICEVISAWAVVVVLEVATIHLLVAT